MRFFLVREAYDRPGRISRLLKRAQNLATARSMAMKHEPKGGQKWVGYGRRAYKAAAVHAKFKALSRETDPATRRRRLAGLAQAARKGYSKARAGSQGAYGKKGPYQRASKALKVYQKFRYEPIVKAKRTLTKGGLVHDPTTAIRKTKHSYKTLSKRTRLWHVQPSSKKKPYIPGKPSEHPAISVQRAIAKRIGKKTRKVAKRFGVSPHHPTTKGIEKRMIRGALKRRGFSGDLPKKPVDKSQKLPSYATREPERRRIKSPVIRRARVHQNLGVSGHHPMNVYWKKPIGRREIRAQSRFSRKRD